MSESTFLSLMYIFILFNRDKYSKSVISSFKRSVIFEFRDCCSAKEFCFRFNRYGSDDMNYNRICSNFVKFIRENNRLLGYNS